MSRSAPWLLVAALLLGVSPAVSADVSILPSRAPVVVEEAPPPPVMVEPAPVPDAVVVARPGPLLPPPEVRFGCQRVWRCDTTVCEWRRGCWGVYGYVEGPYYTPAFARRQWESHGFGSPQERRPRSFK
jgi:hypothetical protein